MVSRFAVLRSQQLNMIESWAHEQSLAKACSSACQYGTFIPKLGGVSLVLAEEGYVVDYCCMEGRDHALNGEPCMRLMTLGDHDLVLASGDL